ncbi:MAG: glycosyltransferase N-terminal domain-containing protein [Bacteroidales bacterium]
MKILYSLIIILYAGLARIASLFNNKASLWVKGRSGWEKAVSDAVDTGSPKVWVHCASLGEFEQGRPVIEKIRETMPDHKILVTFFSPSGYEIRKDWPGADWVFYLPTDTRRNARRFIELVNPSAVIFVKYEFWNNIISELSARKIPLLLISAIFRRDQHFFKWYGSFFRKMLSKFTHIFVQDQLSLDLLKSIGIDQASISGDTRFDRVKKLAGSAKVIEKIDRFRGGDRVIVAGSSWQPDEEIICRYINTNGNDLKWIIAPHEIDRQNLERIARLLTARTVFYSGNDADLQEARVMIIDNIGMLSSVYSYAFSAIVGGGFGKGIHNILEPACWGIPVMFGPNHTRFREAVELIEKGGAYCYRNYKEFEKILGSLLNDSVLYEKSSAASREYVESGTGATEKIVALLLEKRY